MNPAGHASHLRDASAPANLAAIGPSPEALGAPTTVSPIGIFVTGPAGEVEYANDRWYELTGLTTAEAIGTAWMAALHPDDADRVTARWASAAKAAESASYECRLQRVDGTVLRVEAQTSPIGGHGGPLTGWVGTLQDLTARTATEAARTAATERYRIAFDHAPVGLGVVTPDGTWLEVNRAFCRLLGYSEEELLTMNLAELTVPAEALVQVDRSEEVRSETRYLRADGTALWVATCTTLVRDPSGEPLYFVVQIEDIGDRKQTERELRQLADHDSLTGLLNRRGFMDGLRRELRRMERNGEYGALLLLDLDNFKLVNDTAGHLAGDQVLRTTADVLRRRMRATDVIGRLGGDEFAALVLNVTPRQASEIAAETTEALRSLTVTAGDVTLEVTASIGVIAIDEMRAENEEDLLAAADRAMYRAKSQRSDD